MDHIIVGRHTVGRGHLTFFCPFRTTTRKKKEKKKVVRNVECVHKYDTMIQPKRDRENCGGWKRQPPTDLCIRGACSMLNGCASSLLVISFREKKKRFF